MEQQNATCTNVSASASSVPILAERRGRRSWAVYNDSAAYLYLKFGTSASTTSFTVRLDPGAYYESFSDDAYNGAIAGIWSSATGSARVTEVV